MLEFPQADLSRETANNSQATEGMWGITRIKYMSGRFGAQLAGGLAVRAANPAAELRRGFQWNHQPRFIP